MGRWNTFNYTRLKAVLDGVRQLDSTCAAQNMTDQIISLFQKEQDDSEDSHHTESDDKTDSLSSGQSDHRELDLDSVSSQDTDDNTDSLSSENQKTVNAQENGDASEETNTEAPSDSQEENIKAVLESDDHDWPEDTFEQLSEELTSWGAGQQGGLSAITTTPSVDRVEVVDMDREEGQKLLWKTKAESARLAAQLTGLVQAKTLCRNRTGKRGEKLDGKRLHRMAIGDSRLFCKRSEAMTIDATVHLCLDISSSMASRMELARDAVLALAYALNQINGVTVFVSAYPGKNDSGVFEVMKSNDRLQDVAAVLSALNAHDSTPMATGLWHAVHQVLHAKADRRLIIMITDGAPDCDHHQPVMELVKRCEQSGIEVVGLGINVNSVEKLFPQSVVVTKLSELKSALFECSRLWLAA